MIKRILWRGIWKVIEETGELLQVIGKLGAFPNGEHPDGKGDLRLRLQEEIADAAAALYYFAEDADLDRNVVTSRYEAKLAKFRHWELEGIGGLSSSEQGYRQLYFKADADIAALRVAHDRRVSELLEANNREVERRRVAERRLADLDGPGLLLMADAGGGP